MAEFILLGSILILTLFGLAVLRADAGRLVLGPLQRMLKIVVRCEFFILEPMLCVKADRY